MQLLERIIWGLSGLAVVLVIGLIVVEAAGISFRPSVLTDADVKHDFNKLNPHLKDGFASVMVPTLRGRNQGAGGRPGAPSLPGRGGSPGGRAGERGGPPGGPGEATGPGGGPAGPGYQPPAGGGYDASAGGYGGGYDDGGALPETPPVYLPYSLVEKYRHVQDARIALNSAHSAEIEYGGGTAVQLGQMAADSPLRQYLGLEPHDIVISVNNRRVSKSNGMALYEELKDENNFRVEVERNGVRFIVKYQIKS